MACFSWLLIHLYLYSTSTSTSSLRADKSIGYFYSIPGRDILSLRFFGCREYLYGTGKMIRGFRLGWIRFGRSVRWLAHLLVGGLIDKVGGKVKLRAGRPGFCGGGRRGRNWIYILV